MSGNDPEAELEQLFWGVLAVYRSQAVPAGLVPTGTEPLSIPVALGYAQMLVYRNESQQVRAALDRVQRALLERSDDNDGRVDLHAYNLRLMETIEDERAVWDRLDAQVEDMRVRMDLRLR